ncbi:MAG: tRNA dihydrouridine synthase DusB [Eggerthellaceae bacterium]|nr:tRNA dihydrouridine synthase DusB [Eggerthellaceae bacterium]MCH4221136.1 tRNA dihydrouridine synthase DusB [Eggerthellaceae bacterium]
MSDFSSFLHNHRVILAPMAGVSDQVMRTLCIEHGAQLTYTEMISAQGLAYGSQKTRSLLDRSPLEDVVAVQLFGHKPDVMAREAARVEDLMGDHLACIDINMGCPAHKVVKKGDGASLMLRPDEAHSVVQSVVHAVDVPVTVKFRRGYASGEETAPCFAHVIEDAGASAVTVHGRYAGQLYHGKADWGVIGRVVKAVTIPVIGNGDIVDGKSGRQMMDTTGCTALMIARASEGNPWVFDSICAALEGRDEPMPPTPLERLECARRHAHMQAAYDPYSIVRMRKQAAWYCKGLPGASVARAAFNHCSTVDDYDAVFDELECYNVDYAMSQDEVSCCAQRCEDIKKEGVRHG